MVLGVAVVAGDVWGGAVVAGGLVVGGEVVGGAVLVGGQITQPVVVLLPTAAPARWLDPIITPRKSATATVLSPISRTRVARRRVTPTVSRPRQRRRTAYPPRAGATHGGSTGSAE